MSEAALAAAPPRPALPERDLYPERADPPDGWIDRFGVAVEGMIACRLPRLYIRGMERMARLVRECQEIPGYEVFQYLDDAGERHAVDSEDVNAYLREIVPEERFTAKDFRTWMGTVHALTALRDAGPCESEKETKSKLLAAVDFVAEQLSNTRAVCRDFYIHPDLLSSYEAGCFFDRLLDHPPEEPEGLRKDERALLAFLRTAGGS